MYILEMKHTTEINNLMSGFNSRLDITEEKIDKNWQMLYLNYDL